MKWSIAGLVVAGIVAAIGAAVLVMAVRAGAFTPPQPSPQIATQPSEPEQASLLVAAGPMASVSVVDSASVAVRKVAAKDMPQEALSDPVQVVGRVLTSPMVPGQAFTKGCFALEGSGVHLAAALPRGKRAFGVSLTDHAALAGLLYPGSVVDVLATFQVPKGSDTRSEPVSITLLQNIQVLAVEDDTVASGKQEPGKLGARLMGKNRLVTLLVDAAAARVLQLAAEHGTISLVMRNPLDTKPVGSGMAMLSGLSEELSRWMTPEKPVAPVAMAPPPASQPATAPAVAQTTRPADPPPPRWVTQVIHGQTVENRAFHNW